MWRSFSARLVRRSVILQKQTGQVEHSTGGLEVGFPGWMRDGEKRTRGISGRKVWEEKEIKEDMTNDSKKEYERKKQVCRWVVGLRIAGRWEGADNAPGKRYTFEPAGRNRPWSQNRALAPIKEIETPTKLKYFWTPLQKKNSQGKKKQRLGGSIQLAFFLTKPKYLGFEKTKILEI